MDKNLKAEITRLRDANQELVDILRKLVQLRINTAFMTVEQAGIYFGNESMAALAKHKKGTCRECGCTEDNACEGGCSWADFSETVCSNCY